MVESGSNSRSNLLRTLLPIWIVVFLAAIGVAVFALRIQPQKTKPAPDFSLTLLSGKRVSLGDYRGKPLILNFWASW